MQKPQTVPADKLQLPSAAVVVVYSAMWRLRRTPETKNKRLQSSQSRVSSSQRLAERISAPVSKLKPVTKVLSVPVGK